MTQPEKLSKDEQLTWSTGRGTDVWAMFCAAREGDLQAIKTLLEKDPSLVRSEYDYRRPITFAVCADQPHVVEYLLQQGASPVESGTSDTLLQMAKDRGFLKVQQLLEQALAMNASGNGGAIAEAIRNYDLKKVKAMLDAAPALVNASDERSNQPIHWAVMTRQPDVIDELLSRGADINAKRADGGRPIHLCNGDYHHRGWRDVPKHVSVTPAEVYKHLVTKGAYIDMGMAAATGNIERVRELLKEDPSLANRLADYVTYYIGSGAPLKNAAAGGHIEIVKLLLEHGADPNLPEEGIAPKGHALYSAVLGGHYEIAKLLLEHGAYPNPPVESSADALSMAMRSPDKKMAELLCSYGAARSLEMLAYYGDVMTAAAMCFANPALANDPTALENAAGQGHESFVKLLLHYQPDLVKRIAVGVNSQGSSDPIRSKELTLFLFQKGMNANHRNWLGITPLHRFAQRDDVANAAIFLEQGADINAMDEEYRSTPLGYAARSGKKNMVEFLLSKGADPSLPVDPAWARPMTWASSRNHQEIVSLLEQHKAK